MGENLGRCCICVPTRLGVFMLGIFIFLSGLVCLIGLFLQDVRFISGGYSHATMIVSGIVGSLGMIFGFLGCLGAHDNSARYILAFLAYYGLRTATNVAVFTADMITLAKCETWLQSSESEQNWNPTLETISAQGLCQWTRYCYVTAFTVDFLLSAYFILIILKYYQFLNSKPASLLRFPGDSFVPGAGYKSFEEEADGRGEKEPFPRYAGGGVDGGGRGTIDYGPQPPNAYGGGDAAATSGQLPAQSVEYY
uniref:Uncharacterized protein n=1 Tax=Chromera velia CCMP2878 TaxID=1169474 RepID=A0A0G4GG11_9ALVE|eukprot:Cvel_21726.t1-p1 / transcript=Cvel_21726.t1 / gene=Cvel_21726 / organism=Chromera_velia_CCMP2878 / gene_product=hypothetical protein / transcript_product=hypothetical protein / location=Cvel_scaffold2062:15926-17868(-) / protein_length=251 / sequence_SO=supercontig / SO=protein_coding / is_pseudo=false